MSIDIATELAKIASAVYGEEVRGSIYDALSEIAAQCNIAIGNQLLTVDSTLTQTGQGADAKKTGDELAQRLSLSYGDYTIIESGNLNSYSGTAASYAIRTAADASNITSMPIESPGRLFVFPAGNDDGVLQVFITSYPSGKPRIFIRGYKQSWNEWLEIALSDEISSIQEDLKSAIDDALLSKADYTIWESGGVNASTGDAESNSIRIRTRIIPKSYKSLYTKNNYKFMILAYNNGAYVGCWDGTSFATSETWFTEEVFYNYNGQYDIVIVGKNHEGSSITTNAASNFVFRGYQYDVKRMDEANFEYTYSSSSTGGNNFNINIYKENIYSIKNNTTGFISARTRNSSSADIDVISENIAPGKTVTFIATGDAVILRVFFNVTGSVTFSGQNKTILAINNKVAETRNFSKTLSADSTGEKVFSENIKKGYLYQIVNNTTENVGVTTKNANGSTVDTVSTALKPNEAAMFIASGDASILRVYFNATGSVTFYGEPNSELNVFNDLQSTNGVLNRISPVNYGSNISWEIGGIQLHNGALVDSVYRLRSQAIPIIGNTAKISVSTTGYQYLVFEYMFDNTNITFSVLSSYTTGDWLDSTKTYTIQNKMCRFIRIAIKKSNDGAFTDTSAGAYFSCVQGRLDHYAAGRYVASKNEEYNYTGNLEEYSTSDKLEALYEKWETLREEYPNVITKEVLGTVSGLEMRCYTIVPPALRVFYHGSSLDTGLKILYISSVHGDEAEISMDDYTFFENLVENHQPKVLWENCVFKVIPTGNPYGYNANIRNNANNVNLNRNFPVGWEYVDPSVDPYNSSGDAPASEPETQILMKFFSDNNDAFIAINRHGTAPWSQENKFGYVASDYQEDLLTAISSEAVIDEIVKTEYPITKTYNPDENIMFIAKSNRIGGTMDRYYQSLGIHGYLFEFCNLRGTYTITKDELRKIGITATGNILKDSCINNRRIIENPNMY